MKLEAITKRLATNYARAVKLKFVIKPMSYALYQTWQWANEYEKPRKVPFEEDEDDTRN